MAQMRAPRCGIKDRFSGDEESRALTGNGDRSKRYAVMGPEWSRRRLTYRIEVYSRKVTRKQADSDIAKAFKVGEAFRFINRSMFIIIIDNR